MPGQAASKPPKGWQSKDLWVRWGGLRKAGAALAKRTKHHSLRHTVIRARPWRPFRNDIAEPRLPKLRLEGAMVPSFLKLRSALAPGGGTLVGVADAKHGCFVEVSPDNLQRQRQTLAVEAVAHRQRRLPGQVERAHIGRPLGAEIGFELSQLRRRVRCRRQQDCVH